MNMAILKEIGLTGAQIKVYLALLELGSTKSGAVIKKTGLSGSVVYRALENLLEKGLVSFTIKAKTKFFSGAEPKNLLRLWEDRKRKLEGIIPKLESKQKKVEEKQESKMFIGWKGVQTAYNSIFDVLPKGSEYIAFAAGVSKEEPESVKIFFQNFHRKRISMKYDVKLIINKKHKELFLKRYKLVPKIKIKYIDNFAPEGITIFGDNVLIVTFKEEKPIAIIITSKQIANSFREMFFNMWKIVKS